MGKYDELIGRLERLKEPDRNLFEGAYVACFGTVDWNAHESYAPFSIFLKFLDFGAWEQAALMLIKPADEFEIGSAHLVGHYWAFMVSSSGEYRGKGKTLAIAICIAALKSRE